MTGSSALAGTAATPDAGAAPGVATGTPRADAVWAVGPAVSVVIAANAADGLALALASVMGLNGWAELEVVVADGCANDAVARVVAAFPGVRRIENPAGTTPAGLNRAFAASAHPVVVRCDARSVLPPDYLRRAVASLARKGVAVVGGVQAARGETPFENAVAAAIRSPLGAGGARWRGGGGCAGPADTVYLGVFSRAAVEAVGGYDERLLRNQDYELNWRLRRAGGTVWFDPALNVAYRPRGTLGALWQQYFDYGRYKRRMLRLHPRALRPRQLAAPLLVLGLAASAALAAAGFTAAAALLPVVWLGAVGVGALAAAGGRADGHAPRIALALGTMHLAWGAGFLGGRTDDA